MWSMVGNVCRQMVGKYLNYDDMKTRILTFFFILFSLTVNAQRSELPEGLSLALPDGYELTDQEGYALAALKGNDVILVKMMDSGDFDLNKFMNRADRLYFNLKDYSLVDKENEKFYMIRKNFLKKYYEAENGGRVMTFSSHTRNNVFIVLATYSSQEDKEALEAMFGSIEVTPEKWLQRIWYVFQTGLGFICMIFLLISLVASIIGEDSIGLACLTGLIGYGLLFIGFWGDWPVYLSLVAVGTLFASFASSMKTSDLLQSMVDGI